MYADAPLPRCMLITGGDPHQPQQFLLQLERVLQTGISLVQLRAPDLSIASYLELATAANQLCLAYASKLILNPPKLELTLPTNTGLHLTSQRLMNLTTRSNIASSLIGASCHDAVQLNQAAVLQLDYALLSPVLATASHPEAETLGWYRFADLVKSVSIPVYALGGLDTTALPIAQQHGAYGIAAIRGIWPGH